MHNSDQTIISRLKEGDKEAFEVIYFQKVNKMRGFLQALRLDTHAEDILQETFITLWKKRESLRVEKSIDNYLFAIAKNFALKALRQKIYLELTAEKNQLVSTIASPDHQLIVGEYQKAIQNVVEQLPDRPKQIFKLRREEGLTVKEIADRLGISKSTVENHMNRALAHIKSSLPEVYFLFVLFTEFTLLNI